MHKQVMARMCVSIARSRAVLYHGVYWCTDYGTVEQRQLSTTHGLEEISALLTLSSGNRGQQAYNLVIIYSGQRSVWLAYGLSTDFIHEYCFL
jgi:hypothetical protein